MTGVKVMTNPLKELQKYGQSVWLDYIRRSLIKSGELKRMIDEDGLRGMTSNPAIFEKAIAGSTDYSDFIKSFQSKGVDSAVVYEKLAVRDIQDAADLLLPVYKESKKRDGYISLEVSPFLANDTAGTLAEAKRLWKDVARPNVMIKVPGTKAGLPAVKELISEGINVNVTLLFFQKTYEEFAEAYIEGLEAFDKKGGDVSGVASVASFFISRIDSLIDKQVEDRLKQCKDDKEKQLLESVTGKVAIANGKLTYQKYKEIFNNERWNKLKAKGAMTQRVLWASTSTKNPKYPDTLYVDELIGPDTVNTIPPATYDAFKDHGHVGETLEKDVDKAKQVMQALETLKISMKQVTDELVEQGVKLFCDPFQKLLDTVADQLKQEKSAIDNFSYKLPADLDKAVKASLEDWDKNGKVKKLWAKDASLWTGKDEAKWLDWLNVAHDQQEHIEHLTKIAADIKSAGFTHALLLGMGGSSLCPEVLSLSFGKKDGYPELHVLDSVDPAQVVTREKQINIAKTIFIVSSKSGSTLEPNIFKQYFFQRTVDTVGKEKAGEHFIAITDPGSKMQKVAEQDKFRHIFYGLPGIGGRYSALSDFGLVPAAIMGIDVNKFIAQAQQMVEACSATVPVAENPGVVLGTILGVLAKSGRDKVTLVASPKIHDIGAWLEQLLAESTGKQGKGLIPVDREKLGAPEVYSDDRVFAYLRLQGGADKEQDAAIDAIEKAGQPVVRINVADVYDLGQEFFRWEIATAVAGSIIGINSFDQPDVEASKIATREITDAYEKSGSLPDYKPFFEAGGIKLFSDDNNVEELNKAVGSTKSLAAYLKAHFNRIKSHDYVATLAYIEMNDQHEASLQSARTMIRDKKKVATCLGFGPRFQHSTGQAYKGGPNSGVFVQVTAGDRNDVKVPEQTYTFGIVKEAQARGDFKVLGDRGRRALRVHLGKELEAGLKAYEAAVKEALS